MSIVYLCIYILSDRFNYLFILSFICLFHWFIKATDVFHWCCLMCSAQFTCSYCFCNLGLSKFRPPNWISISGSFWCREETSLWIWEFEDELKWKVWLVLLWLLHDAAVCTRKLPSSGAGTGAVSHVRWKSIFHWLVKQTDRVLRILKVFESSYLSIRIQLKAFDVLEILLSGHAT